MIAFVFGFGALGFMIGVLSSWSATPVVSALLPLAFALTTAPAGFILGKTDLTKERIDGSWA